VCADGGGEGVGKAEVVTGLIGKLLEGGRERVVLRVEDTCHGWFRDRAGQSVGLWAERARGKYTRLGLKKYKSHYAIPTTAWSVVVRNLSASAAVSSSV